MARLFGLIGNRGDLAGRVLAAESDALSVAATVPVERQGGRAASVPLGWGIGFYQGGEVLMRRRPVDDRPLVDVAANGADVRADLVVGHVRAATIGTLRTENTHPFRYRQWLWAQTGTLTRFEGVRERMIQSVPDFMRGDIRGETDSEVIFHVFLSFLHDAGRLHELQVEEPVVRDALRSTMAVVDGMAAEAGQGPVRTNIIVANGDFAVALARGATMATRSFAGRSDADALIGEDVALRRRAPELGKMHFALLASDFDETPAVAEALRTRWRPVSGHAIVTLTRGHDPKIEAL